MNDIRTVQDGDNWLLATNFRTLDGNGAHGSLDHDISRVRTTYEVWTGERWWGQRASGMKFDNKESAVKFMDENYEILIAAM